MRKQVKLYNNGIRKTFGVHNIILPCFLPNDGSLQSIIKIGTPQTINSPIFAMQQGGSNSTTKINKRVCPLHILEFVIMKAKENGRLV